MKNKEDLRKLLLSIDRRGYPAYKDTRGQWSFGNYILSIDHVQGDPFASPSNVSILVPGKAAGFPAEYMELPHRRIALQDTLLRLFGRAVREREDRKAGSGKSGLIAVSVPGQEILERTACRVNPANGNVTMRFEIGFPAYGRSINAEGLIRILFDFLPQAAAASLFYRNTDHRNLKAAIDLADDQEYIRDALPGLGLCAFVADGAVLPRKSGVSSLPMREAVPFRTPETMAVTLDLPHRGKLRGMGIRRGVTLIVGGGYHGKSTLLQALERGVYNHIAGDGREYVITDDTAVKIRAEDGRSITNTDISLFINDLPNGKDTVRFSTEDASGSTSQAANVVEAIEAGSKLLLIDEDTSATNFMVRDEMMARAVSREKEPITPFIARIRDLYEKAGISTILVAGSSGAFFHTADTVIQMDQYVPVEITAQAKAIAAEFGEASSLLRPGDFRLPDFRHRIPHKNSALLREGRVKLKVLSPDSFLIAKDEVQMRGLEQILEREQTAALAHILKYMELHLLDGRLSFTEVLDRTMALLTSEGLEKFFDGSTVRNGLAQVRRAEAAGMLNRYRKL